MCQVSNGAVAVLKVKRVEKFLGLLIVDLVQRLAHGERRARIFRHRVGLHLRLSTMHGENISIGRIRTWNIVALVGSHGKAAILTSAAVDSRSCEGLPRTSRTGVD